MYQHQYADKIFIAIIAKTLKISMIKNQDLHITIVYANYIILSEYLKTCCIAI